MNYGAVLRSASITRNHAIIWFQLGMLWDTKISISIFAGTALIESVSNSSGNNQRISVSKLWQIAARQKWNTKIRQLRKAVDYAFSNPSCDLRLPNDSGNWLDQFAEYRSESLAQAAVDSLSLTINQPVPQGVVKSISVETSVNHYR